MSTTMSDVATVTMSPEEKRQVQRANKSGKQPVAFVHGLWLLQNSWDRWVKLFEKAGYVAITPGWPDDPETVAEAHAHPEVLAGKSIKDIADYVGGVIGQLDKRPAVIGHSFGGLMTEIIAGRGLAAVSVAISPAPHRGVLPLPISSLRVASVAVKNPRNRNRAVPLTFEQFRYGFGNAIDEKEAKELYKTYSVAGPGKTLFQAAAANLNPWSQDKVDTKNPERGPMLLIAGGRDHTVPWSITNASYKREHHNKDVTEIVKFPDRAHSLTIDHGWQEVAQTALEFVKRFV
jgi:pimeloyl-ACP methyl ester carboxylesterase